MDPCGSSGGGSARLPHQEPMLLECKTGEHATYCPLLHAYQVRCAHSVCDSDKEEVDLFCVSDQQRSNCSREAHPWED